MTAEVPTPPPTASAEAMPILRLSLPIVAGLAASTLIGVVDTVMIAPLGTVALAAASLTTAVIIIFYSALYGFLSALGVEAAHRHGAGDEDGVARALRAGLRLALGAGVAGAVVMAGVFLLLPAIGQPPEVIAILGPYWLAMSGLLIPVAFLMAISQVLNAIDRPWTAAGFAFAGVILNVPLNYLLIWGAGGWDGLGLLGAGLASVIANGLALTLAVVWLGRSGLLVRRARVPGLTRRLARDGLPLGIGYTGEGAAFAVVGLMLGLFGAVALAANQIVQAVSGVLYMLPLGMSAATAIRVGQAIGGGERERLRDQDRASAAVQGDAAERRLHADGVRRSCAGAVLRPEPCAGLRHHADGPQEGAGGGRRVQLRGGRDQGGAGDGLRAPPSAPAAMHDGKGMIVLFPGRRG
jgi:multidrug resistance protein, MATE family